jgi:hypothetical protein
MSRIALAALGVTALFAAGPVQARDCVTGWIAHVDRQNDTITLDSGEMLQVSGDINFEDLSEGSHVKFVVTQTGEGRKAVSIAPADTSRPAGRV